MAIIPGNLDKINDIEVSSEAPVTEALMNKIGADINALIDLSGFASNSQEFTSSGTFNVPEDVTSVLIYGCGGGGAAGDFNAGFTGIETGSAGGNTLFGPETLLGGVGGLDTSSVFPHMSKRYSNSEYPGGLGGRQSATFLTGYAQNGASNAYFSGGLGGSVLNGGGSGISGGGGAAGPFGVGGAGAIGGGPGVAGSSAAVNTGAGGGAGSGGLTGGDISGAQGGAGAPLGIQIVSVTPLAAISVTIGPGGSVGAGATAGGAGGSGKLIVFW